MIEPVINGFEGTMLSRAGSTHPSGKLTRRLDIPVSEATEDAVIALAAVAGINKSEFVRGVIERALFGDVVMLRRIAQGMGMRPLDNDGMNAA